MKALVISNRLSGWKDKVEIYKKLMPFLTGIIIVSPTKIVKAFNISDSYLTVIDESEFISDDMLLSLGLNGFEHASFNFILRTNCILSDKLASHLGEEFIMMDDDNIPLLPISKKLFIDNGKYSAFFYAKLNFIVPRKFCYTSYDVSLIATRKALEEKAIKNGLVFSSHMPQVINRRIFKEAYHYINAKKHQFMICDWTMYFNVGIKLYPHRFLPKPAPVVCWPMNISSVPSYMLSKEKLFENFYKESYQEEGIFSKIPAKFSLENLQRNHKIKKQLFEQHISKHSKKSAWLRYITLLLLDRLVTQRAATIFNLVLKSKRIYGYQNLSKSPYILTMKSRRWPHKGNTYMVSNSVDTINELSKLSNSQVIKVKASDFNIKVQSLNGGTIIFIMTPLHAKCILQASEFPYIQHKKLVIYILCELNNISNEWKSALDFFDEVWVNDSIIKAKLELFYKKPVLVNAD